MTEDLPQRPINPYGESKLMFERMLHWYHESRGWSSSPSAILTPPGVVVNRTTISGALPVDPIVLQAENVVDGTGHEAVAVERLRARKLLAPQAGSAGSGEGPLDATAGEAFVVERVAEAYPGLWVTGMAVCATFGGPRMGPIFGGMLLSGRRVAELILEKT